LGLAGSPLNSSDSLRTQWIGYHGTSLNSANAITHGAYAISEDDSDWLGHGAYFFIAGLNDPMRKAYEWAEFRAWDKNTQSHKYKDFAVLQSSLLTEKHLDLDDPEDLEIFETVRSHCMHRMKKEGFRGSAMQSDCYLSNFAMRYLDLDALVRKEAIQTHVRAMKTRIPNCRILCLKDPLRCASGHKIVRRGTIK